MKNEAKKAALMKMKDKYKSKRMEDMMPDLEGMKKVTVMSDSEEGLKEGLSKAEQIMKMKGGMKDEDESEEYADGGCKDKKKYKKYKDGGSCK